MDLIAKNKEMLAANLYNTSDTRQMLKIDSLEKVNDYDLYLIACALCNYDIPEKAEVRELRMKYFLATNNGNIDGFEHTSSDYIKSSKTSITCKNKRSINKYGLYEYVIDTNNKELVSDLWSYKSKDCLKYVDNKSHTDKIIISISKTQFNKFISMLDELLINYDLDDLASNNSIAYDNTSKNSLIDINELDLPFTPYPFQLEDAEKIVKMKRALLGHEMGCFTGDTKVYLADGSLIDIKSLVNKEPFTVFSYNTETKQFVTSTAIAKKTRKNVNLIKVKYCDTSLAKLKEYEVFCTPDHKFLTLTGWVEAKDLKPDAQLISKEHIIKIVNVEYTDRVEDVYCLTVNNTHSFVIEGNIVVHNCGKTFISILVGLSINESKLVICPESLRLNWKKEILSVNKDLDVQILLSNEEFHYGEDWTIVGYKTASKFVEQLKQFNCVFVDECHNCKAVNNWGKPTSKRANAVIDITTNAKYCYLLSGTPMPSHNKDLFNILKMLKCEKFDFNNKWVFKNYADKFCAPRNTRFGMDYSGNSNSSELHSLLNLNMIRRLKKDVLPDLHKQRIFIPIVPKFKADYKDIENRLYYPKKDDTYMGLAMSGRKILSNYKINDTIDLADSLVNAGESVVIVTCFKETADKLIEYYADNCCEIRGGMSDVDKQASIEIFQSKKVQVCVLSLKAGGVGITLTAAHTMIIVDYDWLPADMIQVEDRICRTGQTESCLIYYVYCENSILDNTFIETISDKSENIDLVVDDSENTYNINEEKIENSTYLEKLKLKIESTTKPVTKTRKKASSK